MKKTDENYQEYLDEMKRVWGEDTRMIEFCTKKASQVIKLTGGEMIEMEQPTITKDFCFGYSTCGYGPEYEEAMKSQAAASRNMEQYFIDYNMQHGFGDIIDKLNDESTQLYIGIRCMNGKNLYHYYILEDWQVNANPALLYKMHRSINEATDKLLIVKAVEQEQEKFKKRLRTWWKRNGKDKVRTWVYWMDD